MNNGQKDMKTFVENLVASFTQKGIKVASAAIIKFEDDQPIIGNRPSEVEKAVNNVLNTINKDGFLDKKTSRVNKTTETPIPVPTPKTETPTQETKEKDETCFCPECFNFNTFEEILGSKEGNFDYSSVTLGGREFNIKYWTNGNKEYIMINPKKLEVNEKLTLDQLQEALNSAVQMRDFKASQAIVNRINELKNQDGGK